MPGGTRSPSIFHTPYGHWMITHYKQTFDETNMYWWIFHYQRFSKLNNVESGMRNDGHFQLSLRYGIGQTKKLYRFLGGISRLSYLVSDNPILLVYTCRRSNDQIILIAFVPCFISFSEGIWSIWSFAILKFIRRYYFHQENMSVQYIPLKPHLYFVKLRYAGVYLFFLFMLRNIDCGYSAMRSNVYPNLYFEQK